MLNRKQAPPFQKTLSIALPQPIEARLASGISLFGLKGLEQNVVKIEVVFSSGKWFESKPGLSHFTSALLEKGTAGKTAQQIADTLDLYGASLEINPGFDFVSIALFSLRTNLEQVFPLFLEILQDPSFPEAEWELMKDIFLQNLKINNEKTSYRAGCLIRRNIFGADHPYGTSIEETDVQHLNAPDFQKYFQSTFKVHSIYWVGQLSDAEIGMMYQGFQSLRGAEEFPDRAVGKASVTAVEHVDKAGSLQSSIRLGKRSLSKRHPDYFDLLMFNHLLGGFFGSRLMKNIREDKGLTYGISSSLSAFAMDTAWMIGAEVNKSNLELAIAEIRAELRDLRETEVEEGELMLARNHFIGSLQSDMANLFSVIEKIKNIHLNNLPLTYYQDLFHRVDQVSPKDLLRVANQHLSADSLFEVAVG